MYTAFKHSHMLLAVLTLLMSSIFLADAWRQLHSRKTTLWYILTRIFGGLAALTGLALTFIGPWQHMMYPYIGLILYVLHGLCAGFAKRQITAGTLPVRRTLLATQWLMLVAASALMAMKPF